MTKYIGSILLLVACNALAQSDVVKDPTKTTYWGKDSKVFMQEIRDWLTNRQKPNAGDGK